ncbi:hypothetical protein I6E29_07090 [Arcanobacterium haemolyticum]|nr:hypothetical protein [Arcanobacterium haemolyticum]
MSNDERRGTSAFQPGGRRWRLFGPKEEEGNAFLSGGPRAVARGVDRYASVGYDEGHAEPTSGRGLDPRDDPRPAMSSEGEESRGPRQRSSSNGAPPINTKRPPYGTAPAEVAAAEERAAKRKKRRNRILAFIGIVGVAVINYAKQSDDDPKWEPVDIPTYDYSLPSIPPIFGESGAPSDGDDDGSGDAFAADPSLAPAGSTIVGSWAMEYLGFNPDATAHVAGKFGDDAEDLRDGYKYVGIKVRVTNLASAPRYASFYVGVLLKDSSGETYFDDVWYEGDDALSNQPQTASGEAAEGWLYMQVPQSLTEGDLTFISYLEDDRAETTIHVP